MIRIGAKVRIKKKGADGTFNPLYAGEYGIVKKRQFGTGPAPVGESSTDPLYIVETQKGTDGFWTEELDVL